MKTLLLVSAMTCLVAANIAHADDLPKAVVGSAAPDFTAIGIDDKPFKLSEKLAGQDKNIVLLFSRAHW